MGLWNVPNNYTPAPTSDYANEHPTSVKVGSHIGNGAFSYSKMTGPVGVLGGDHWFMEAVIPVSALDGGLLSQPFTAHWTMGCANDWIEVDPFLPVSGSWEEVPEPASLSLFGLGLLGLISVRRK